MLSGRKSLAILLALAFFASASFCLQICVRQPIDHCGKKQPCSSAQLLVNDSQIDQQLPESASLAQLVLLEPPAPLPPAPGVPLVPPSPPPLLSLRI